MTALVYSIEGLAVQLTTPMGSRVILQDISFDVRRGEIVGVVGRSGVGKTTLLRVLGGLLAASRGAVIFDGEAVSGPPQGAVMVFQDYENALLPWRTVARNAALGVEGRVDSAVRHERVAQALALVELTDRASDYPRQLSGGMAQRAQLARALVLEPTVMLMDEPFGALDAITKATLQDVMLRICGETGATVVFVTHDLDEAIYLSDRVIVLGGPPGTITFCAETELPRPRDQVNTRESPRYLQCRHALAQSLRVSGG
jgi:NitT/TauT family transport system ATP-binding protein